MLHYLARYTHRVAISNHRIVNFADGNVSFRWKDYAHGNKQSVMTLTADELLRRFLQHLLPKRFVRIRSFGFLANRQRTESLALCRRPRTPRTCVPEHTLGSTSRTSNQDVSSSTLCSCAAVSRSMVTMGPPHCGQRHAGSRDSLSSMWVPPRRGVAGLRCAFALPDHAPAADPRSAGRTFVLPRHPTTPQRPPAKTLSPVRIPIRSRVRRARAAS